MSNDLPTPLDHLGALAERSFGSEAIGSGPAEARNWRGFTFTVARWNFVFPFSGGFEILTEREIQPIPWAVRWVRGITNVRGEVHTVVDFAEFLGLDGVASPRSATLFRLPDENLKSALMLESRVNLRAFPEFMQRVEEPEIPTVLAPAVSVVLADDDSQWVVLDAGRLCNMPEFVSIARSTSTIH